MDVVAIVCIREDEEYVAGCLSHLIENGVQYAIIDNGLGDASRELLAQARYRKHLVAFAELPFSGAFELDRQIEKKEEVISRLRADWVIHLDADEIMESHVEGESLADAIARIDAQGWTVINFEEYVFLPVDGPYRPGPRLPQPLCSYYYFRPTPGPRLMRARKNSPGLSMTPSSREASAGGHLVFGSEVKLAPESFALRHYIVRDQDHAYRKYVGRQFAAIELERGWHRNRVGHPQAAYAFPDPASLRRLPRAASRAFDRSDPKSTHYWEW
jgi:hypothetical protein